MPVRGILWEQGTGKTKLVIDTAAWMYEEGLIDCVLVLAPNGVHENWVTDELPIHMPDAIEYNAFSYQSHRAPTQWHQKKCAHAIRFKGLSIICISYNGFVTKRGLKFAKKILKHRRCLYVADESQRIKNAGAKRTKTILASSKYADFKRILSGTPITKNPLDIYTQMKFLDLDFWMNHGFASKTAFDTYFARWRDFEKIDANGKKHMFSKPVSFLHQDELQKIVLGCSSRVTKEQALPDLPPKLYTKRYHEMEPQQARVYKEIKEEFMSVLDSGDIVTTQLIITQMLRLQQVVCGYIPDDLDSNTMHFLGSNPRMKLLLDTIEDLDGPVIIWARFRQDINQIMAELGEHAVRFDGSTSQENRLIARQRFQAGDVRFFVANPAAGATGITLTAAKTVIYYSNSFDLEHRLQSEDRAHRIGQTDKVLYIDFVAKNTIDTRIIWALRTKSDLAAGVTGDSIRNWI